MTVQAGGVGCGPDAMMERGLRNEDRGLRSAYVAGDS